MHLSISLDRQSFEIAIQDFGEISEDLDKIFNRFYRIKPVRGNGLGYLLRNSYWKAIKEKFQQSVIGQGIFRIYTDRPEDRRKENVRRKA